MSAPKLTPSQKELLEAIQTSATGGLWVRTYSRLNRTAEALLRKGCVRVSQTAPAHKFYVPKEQ